MYLPVATCDRKQPIDSIRKQLPRRIDLDTVSKQIKLTPRILAIIYCLKGFDDAHLNALLASKGNGTSNRFQTRLPDYMYAPVILVSI